jgi:hypothetical protein
MDMRETHVNSGDCGLDRIRGSIANLREPGRSMATITMLLHRAREGEEGARDALFELAYDTLKSLARSRLRGAGHGAGLDTTTLVHEAYL